MPFRQWGDVMKRINGYAVRDYLDWLMAGFPASQLENSDGEDSYALWAPLPPDFYQQLIRELLSYDALCEASAPFFRRNNEVEFIRNEIPSPLYWSRQIEWPWTVLNACLEPQHTVLDVGSGWSVLKFALAKRCEHVTCMDHEQESLTKAAQTVITLNVNNITQQLGDLRNIPHPDNSFDRVACISVMEHLPDGHEQAIREMQRVLKPGGRLLLSMDVVTSGTRAGDYHVDKIKAMQIMDDLKIKLRLFTPTALAGVAPGSDFQFFVLLCLWVKPK